MNDYELYLKNRRNLYESLLVSYKSLLEEFFINCKKISREEKESWEWYRKILTEGRNESKHLLDVCQAELIDYRQGLNLAYLYNSGK